MHSLYTPHSALCYCRSAQAYSLVDSTTEMWSCLLEKPACCGVHCHNLCVHCVSILCALGLGVIVHCLVVHVTHWSYDLYTLDQGWYGIYQVVFIMVFIRYLRFLKTIRPSNDLEHRKNTLNECFLQNILIFYCWPMDGRSRIGLKDSMKHTHGCLCTKIEGRKNWKMTFCYIFLGKKN